MAVTIAWALLMVPTSSAQQQTGQVAPETRNPQTNAPQLFNQESNLQNTTDNEILNKNQAIQIPTGQPAAKLTENEKTDYSAILWGVGAVLISLLTIIVILGGSSKPTEQTEDTLSSPTKPDEAKTVGAEEPAQKKKMPKESAKKKKRKKRKKRS